MSILMLDLIVKWLVITMLCIALVLLVYTALMFRR